MNGSNKAAVSKENNNFAPAKFMVEVEYMNEQKSSFNLYLSDNGQASAMTKIELFNSIQGFFTIPEELANHFQKLVKQINEIDSSK